MRQQCRDLTRPLRRQPRQHIFEIGIRIVPIHARRLDQAHDRRRPFAAAKRSGKQPIRTAKRPRSDLVFDWIVVYGDSAIIQVARQRDPAFKAVIQGFGRSLIRWAQDRAGSNIQSCSVFANGAAFSCRIRRRSSSRSCPALGVQLRTGHQSSRQRLFGQLTFIRHVQIEKLAAGVGHAADFDHAFLEASFVASKVVAHQLAVP